MLLGQNIAAMGWCNTSLSMLSEDFELVSEVEGVLVFKSDSNPDQACFELCQELSSSSFKNGKTIRSGISFMYSTHARAGDNIDVIVGSVNSFMFSTHARAGNNVDVIEGSVNNFVFHARTCRRQR
jgi:hypothetical protein